MRVVIQRVKEASVTIDNHMTGSIQSGLLLLVGIGAQDSPQDCEYCAKKIANMRIFEDEFGKMNLSVKDVAASVLSISQFTLYASCKKGNRPSFTSAEKPDRANELYQYFNRLLKEQELPVETGEFGADMQVSLINDGPVTILLDSNE